MIEIVNSGWLSLMVDRGRYGFADIGVPPCSALDRYAFDTVNYLVGNSPNTAALEVMGSDFALTVEEDILCAITGARVIALVDEIPVDNWSPFSIRKGGLLRIKEVTEGLRYYVAFSGTPILEKVMGSNTTNIECRFGGFKGRPLMKGDRIGLNDKGVDGSKTVPFENIPVMGPPHVLRVVEGPEMDYFTEESLRRCFTRGEGEGFTVSSRLNRTGVRLEGTPISFRKGMPKSIISEAIVPGVIQVPGDGLPIIGLYERTIGGYGRIGIVARVDHDLLAHLKPRDKALFTLISLDEAIRLWEDKLEKMALLFGRKHK